MNKYAFIALLLVLFFYPATREKFWRKPGEAARIDEMVDDLYSLYPTGRADPENYTEDEEHYSRLFLIRQKKRIDPHTFQTPEPTYLVTISQDDIRIIEHPETEEARKKGYTPLKIETELKESDRPLLIQIKRGVIINITKW